MSAHWPVGFGLGVEGEARPYPQDMDPALSCPIAIISLSAAVTLPLPRGCYVEVSGAFSSGWVIQPNGSGNGNVPLVATACFPVPRDGNLIVSVAGGGTPVLIIWPRHIGERICASRGFAPPGTNTSGSVSPKAAPSTFTTQGLKTPAIAGTSIASVAAGGVPTAFVIITDQANASPIYFAETQAKAALLGAANGGQPLYAAGADVFPVMPGGALWAASVDAAQLCYVRSEVAA